MHASRLSLLLVLFLAVTSSALDEDRTRWVNGTFSEALGLAKESERLVLVYCWEEKEERSVQFYGTLVTDAVMTAMEKWICFSAKKTTPNGDEVLERFSVRSVPAVLFVSADGELIDLIGGVIGPTPFLRELERVARGEETLLLLQTAASGGDEPANLDARFKLAFRYRTLGDDAKEEEQFASIRKADAKGATAPGARAHLIQVMREIADDAGDKAFGFDWDGDHLTFRGSRVRDWSLKPLYAWAKKVKDPHGKFDAWNGIADFEWTQGDQAAALAASEQAHDVVPDDVALDWCADLARKVMGLRGKRPTSQKKLALKLATDCARRAESLDPDAESYKAKFGEQTKDAVLAKYLEPLAYAQKFNGQHGKAVATIERCRELDPTNSQFESSEGLIKSGTWPPPPTDG